MGRNLRDSEKDILDFNARGAKLSLGQLNQLKQIFGGQTGGIADLLTNHIAQLLGINPGGMSPANVQAGNAAGRVNFQNAADLGGQFDQFGLGLNKLTDDISRTRTARGGDLKAINTAADAALEAGMADIEHFRRSGLRDLRTELAPARGLRPGDTPIVDRGAEIVSESNRAAAALSGNIRSQAAQQQLQFPLARRAADLAGLGLQGQFLTGQQQFLSALQQQAFQNRLGLAGSLGSSGLNLAGLGLNVANLYGRGLGNSPGTFGDNDGSSAQQGLGLIGGIAGGLGGLIGGIGGLF